MNGTRSTFRAVLTGICIALTPAGTPECAAGSTVSAEQQEHSGEAAMKRAAEVYMTDFAAAFGAEDNYQAFTVLARNAGTAPRERDYAAARKQLGMMTGMEYLTSVKRSGFTVFIWKVYFTAGEMIHELLYGTAVSPAGEVISAKFISV